MAIEGTIQWAVNGLTILLMIIAASMAIKKKNNLVLSVVIAGNLIAYALLQSPLVCMIISIAGIIWASKLKDSGQAEGSKPSSEKKRIMPGTIIGIIIGAGLIIGPLIAYLGQEASINDSTTQGILILSAVIGAFMVMNNIFKLLE